MPWDMAPGWIPHVPANHAAIPATTSTTVGRDFFVISERRARVCDGPDVGAAAVVA